MAAHLFDICQTVVSRTVIDKEHTRLARAALEVISKTLVEGVYIVFFIVHGYDDGHLVG